VKAEFDSCGMSLLQQSVFVRGESERMTDFERHSSLGALVVVSSFKVAAGCKADLIRTGTVGANHCIEISLDIGVCMEGRRIDSNGEILICSYIWPW
jgi:hypothetical protein